MDFGFGSSVWVDIPKIIAAKSCWLHCFKLNPKTQKDAQNPRCRVRADDGFDAISELAPGLMGPLTSVWKQLINMLLDQGYEPRNTLIAMPYDFRLAPMLLEERDSFFTQMKRTIEQVVDEDQDDLLQISQGITIIAHSMGCQIFRLNTLA